LEDDFLFDEFVQISFDFLFADDVERLLISEFIGFHLFLGLSIENIVERRVFARSFVFLVDVEDLWQFVDVGKRMLFVCVFLTRVLRVLDGQVVDFGWFGLALECGVHLF
jgi:hypothetical protein